MATTRPAQTPADLTFREFMADIVARPHDDVPRLILADWLEDHGAPKRAQFIRLQIEAHNIPLVGVHASDCACRRCSATREADKILRAKMTGPSRRWLWAGQPLNALELHTTGGLGRIALGWRSSGGGILTYARGFVEGITTRLEVWRKFGPAAVAAQPILWVKAGDPYRDEADLVNDDATVAWAAGDAVAWARKKAGLPPLGAATG